MTTEIQYLQNFGNTLGLIIHEKQTEDKRKKVKMYFACIGTLLVSPTLTYEGMNNFLNGWYHCKKHHERVA